MSEIDLTKYDISTPRGRRAALTSIQPDREKAKNFHRELLDIFRREMRFRSGQSGEQVEDGSDYFESIYHCALLLYLIGDVADTPLMWEAKNIDMDTGCGFDGQFLIGAGVDETIRYLERNRYVDAADHLKNMKKAGDFDAMQEWERFRIGYFYP